MVAHSQSHEPFLIVGLPRSRTAWLAAFLTDGDTVCHHELIRQCANVAEYPQKLSHGVGDSSPSVPFYYDRVKAAIGPHKLLFILRDSNDSHLASAASLRDGLGERLQAGRWEMIEGAFNRMLMANPGSPCFVYEDLDDPAVIGAISEYCTGRPLNESRYAVFKDLNITINFKKAYQLTAEQWQQSYQHSR